jgi:oxygen-independent coproporphyrinogen-3 oxidase
MTPGDIPLALYVHLPWCAKKCPYCDFNSFTAPGELPVPQYVDALLADLDLNRPLADERPLVSVFLGGGTPSLFPPAAIGRLIDGIRDRFDLADDAEITMEANPGTVESGDPAGYRDAGINRLSIGAQSFSDGALERLGRIHRSAAIRDSYASARAAGFDNINIDVMYGLPGQDLAAALADIDALIELAPEHISWYHLTLEPNTVFHARPPTDLPDEALTADIQDAGAERLETAGYEQYEVSAWSRPGLSCRHNLNYWRFGDYLAAGAGAHGKITGVDGAGRFERPANPRAYMAAVRGGAAIEIRPVGAGDTVFEYMLNALRLKRGFDLGHFEAVTGLSGTVVEPTLGSLASRGLMEVTEAGTAKPTERGFRYLNEVMAAFLPPAERIGSV